MIAIRVDGSGIIGLGHMMRCISIANELRKNEVEVFFIIAQDCDDTAIINNGFIYYRLHSLVENGLNPDETGEILRRMTCYSLLVDSYNIFNTDFIKLREIAKVAYIDDIFAFDYSVDMLINYNLEANEFYRTNRHDKCEYLLGTDYFPLRQEFVNAPKYTIVKDVKNILITTGSTDPNGISLFLAQLLGSNLKNININILIGKYYDEQYIQQIKKVCSIFRAVKIVEWGQNMADIYIQNDIVVSPGSTSCFEAMSMGVPCVSFEFVENHHMQCKMMEELDLSACLGDFSCDLENRENNVLEIIKSELDMEVRRKRQNLYKKYFDCAGTERISKHLIKMSS